MYFLIKALPTRTYINHHQKPHSMREQKAETNVDVMAPVGSYESLRAAIQAGADSVYFGIEQLNMRARAANNFTTEDLKKIVRICKEHGVRTYLTLNTIMYDHDLELMRRICDTAKQAGVSAVIASDISVLTYARSIELEVHISTQANVSNIEAVKFYSRFADVVILARELTLAQIKKTVEQIRANDIRGPNKNLIQIEVFVHGALCVAISGKCYMSIATYNSSANRGACLQNCRRAYRLIDEETGDELVVENKYIMSPKDLCTIGFIDRLLEAGVDVLKIEGRGRGPEYVYATTKAYREAVDSHITGTYTKEKVKRWTEDLEKVFNRGFWHGGYYLGKQLGEWSGTYGSQATSRKVYVGPAKNYFSQKKIGLFYIETGRIKKGDAILITGPTTGVIHSTVKSIFINDREVDQAEKGTVITIPIEEKVRANDKLFVIVDADRDEQHA